MGRAAAGEEAACRGGHIAQVHVCVLLCSRWKHCRHHVVKVLMCVCVMYAIHKYVVALVGFLCDVYVCVLCVRV